MSKWKSFNFGLETPSNRNETTKKTRDIPFKKPRVPNPIKAHKPSFDFHSNLAPRDISELCVHPKKIEELKFGLEHAFKDRTNEHTSFLLLSGPTGSAKTTTLNLLCKTLDISIREWVNPVDQDFAIVRGPNQAERFQDFVTTESNYTSLFEVYTPRKIILVKDFPNVFLRNHDQFRDILDECYYKCRYPVVFICTETTSKKLDLVYNFFPEEIQQKYQITHISFNACATTFLKNCLKRAHEIVSKNQDIFQVPSSNIVNAIISSSNGDIRCAINQYYFASLLGSNEMPTESSQQVTPTLKRKRTKTLSSIKTMAKDETLGLFHSLGRILNPKRKEHENSWRLNCDVDNLIMELESQPEKVILFLFTNYIKYFGDLKDIQQGADLLWVSQKFFDKWSERRDLPQYALWISVLGLMTVNNHKVSKWNQIEGPKKIDRNILRNQDTSSVLDEFYVNLIKEKRANGL